MLVAGGDEYPLELMGPLTALRVANFVFENSGRPDFGYDFEVVTARPGAIYQVPGLKIVADRPYYGLNGVVDTLLFSPMDFAQLFTCDRRFLSWIARWSRRVRRVGSICYATYVLAEAGVLDGAYSGENEHPIRLIVNRLIVNARSGHRERTVVAP